MNDARKFFENHRRAREDEEFEMQRKVSSLCSQLVTLECTPPNIESVRRAMQSWIEVAASWSDIQNEVAVVACLKDMKKAVATMNPEPPPTEEDFEQWADEMAQDEKITQMKEDRHDQR